MEVTNKRALIIIEKGAGARIIEKNEVFIIEVNPGYIDKIQFMQLDNNVTYEVKEKE